MMIQQDRECPLGWDDMRSRPLSCSSPEGRSRWFLAYAFVLASLLGAGSSEGRGPKEMAAPLDSPVIQLRPIGVVHSAFKQARGTPVQPRVATNAQGTVEVFEEYCEALHPEPKEPSNPRPGK